MSRHQGRFAGLHREHGIFVHVVDEEVVTVRTSDEVPFKREVSANRFKRAEEAKLHVIVTDRNVKLVKEIVILVELVELRPQVIVDMNSLHRLAFHCQIPNLEAHEIARDQITSIASELDIVEARNHLREESVLIGRRTKR